MLCCVCCQDVAPDKRKTKRSHFYCCGVVPKLDIRPADSSKSLFEVRHGMLCCPMDKIKEGIAIGEEVVESEDDFGASKICNPEIPYIGEIPDSLYLGKTIQIHGKIDPYPERFAINLLSGKGPDSNICFHLNPRFDRRVVVRNVRRRGSWGDEEISSERRFPFKPGRNVVITIFVADGNFMVAVNNAHFCKFSFRIPVDEVRSLQIEGDIAVELIFFHNSRRYPTPIPSRSPRIIYPKSINSIRPIIKRKTDIIKPGTVVNIQGRIKLLPQSFYINLQSGSSIVPHADVPLHINLRLCMPGLREQQIILNSWYGGKWGEEIKPDECPFSPGLPFDIRIFYLVEGFQITINQSLVLTFPQRLTEPADMDTIIIEGDVLISKIQVKAVKLTSAAS